MEEASYALDLRVFSATERALAYVEEHHRLPVIASTEYLGTVRRVCKWRRYRSYVLQVPRPARRAEQYIHSNVTFTVWILKSFSVKSR